MRAEPLVDAFTKTEWADTQIRDLHQRIQTFFDGNPYVVTSELNADGSERVWRFKLTEPIPRQWSAIVASILYTLRSPLDQMVAAVMDSLGKSQSGVSFVIGGTSEEFEAELGKQKKLTADLRDLMRETRPYQGGNELIWALHHLNRRDKHRKGLVPLLMPAETRASYIRFDYGLPFVIGCRTGKHLLQSNRPTDAELDAMEPPSCLYETPPGTYLEFGDAGTPGDESLEFMTTTPKAKFDTDFKPALTVGIDHVAVHGEPVVTGLHQMRQAVESILLAFEQRFF